MTIKANSSDSRMSADGYISQYVPPTPETPDSGTSSVYSRDFNSDSGYSVPEDEAYVYNFGTPTSPHERWSNMAHRSAAYSSGGGVRSSVDIVSSKSKGKVSHEVHDLPTTTPIPGYH